LIYLDASAIVKLVVPEPESAALRRFVQRRRQLCVSSALSRTEVARAVLHLGPTVVRRGRDVLAGVELIRLSDRVLAAAGELQPAEVRSLDAIHLATARELGADVDRIVTYDDRMARAAEQLGWVVTAPA
jgi:predicted nucleic acid-binding protein